MPKNYHHLKSYQRYQIEALLRAGKTQKYIANELNVHPSSISRELKRNKMQFPWKKHIYQAKGAEMKAQKRQKEKPKRILFTEDMKVWVKARLVEDCWSPEFISAIGRREGVCLVSHEWIYQWIWSCKRGNRRSNRSYKYLYEYLRHKHRYRKRGSKKERRSLIPGRTPIEERPSIVRRRERVGDIEVDLMMGKNHKGLLLVMTDRATLFTCFKKLESKDAKRISQTIIHTLKSIDIPVKTLTFDNDMAFADHQTVAKALKAKTYFTRPYTSQDKGTVENRIGVIRRFFPKKTDIRNLSEEYIQKVEEKINLRPIRKFNYSNAKEVLSRKIALVT
jgi:transposase, IS30 family